MILPNSTHHVASLLDAIEQLGRPDAARRTRHPSVPHSEAKPSAHTLPTANVNYRRTVGPT
ncbi:hypothetical protein AW168_21035 [Nocardia brasiliensis]|uniref:Uncharacterized protein n=1 Tax=Nocardia brasiliensis (strain ATCC 700358 / HUJEG-1) TaxID=1133849 RepID=K0F5I5_NOCB7|nr:hypothetical protein O3I_034500 [Nocardia brasiliensis ATCC 700358]OCF88193.1 hypothetical protein AW168_21035 [Nocardia brasiliensis]